MYNIFDALIYEECSEEVLNTFKIIIQELRTAEEQFDEIKFKSYLEKKVHDPRKQRKLLKILGDLPEPAE